MGQLRKEPKENAINSDEYRHFEALFLEAQAAAEDNTVTYELDDDEDGATARNLFKLVARMHQVKGFTVYRSRNSNVLELRFKSDTPTPRIGKHRASPAEIADRLDAITRVIAEKGPVSRKDVCDELGIHTPQWNPAIKRLIESGVVVRTGERINTRYYVA